MLLFCAVLPHSSCIRCAGVGLVLARFDDGDDGRMNTSYTVDSTLYDDDYDVDVMINAMRCFEYRHSPC